MDISHRGTRIWASADRYPLLAHGGCYRRASSVCISSMIQFHRPVGRAGSCEDVINFRFGQISQQIILKKMEPVVSPEDLAVNDKAWNAEYSCRNGDLRLLAQSLLDLNRLSLVQEFLPVNANVVGNLTNDVVRSNIFSTQVASRSLTARASRKVSSSIAEVTRKGLSGINGCAGGALNSKPRWAVQRCTS